jgi:hypothetical protein
VGVLIGGYGIENFYRAAICRTKQIPVAILPSGSFVALIPLKTSQAKSDYPVSTGPSSYRSSIIRFQKSLKTHRTEQDHDYIKERLSACRAAVKALIGSETVRK